MKLHKLIVITGTLLLLTAGCKNNKGADAPDAVDQDGPMEEAGEWTDDAAEDVADGTKDAVEETGEAMDEAADDLDGDPDTN